MTSSNLYKQRGFIDASTCLALRRAMDAGTVEEAEILGDLTRRDAGVRRAALIEPSIAVLADVEARLESCRGNVATFLGLRLGAREGPGFVRYQAGDFYAPHQDRATDGSWGPAADREVALVLFLSSSRDTASNGDFAGGVLRIFFAEGEVDVIPEAGLLVAFPAEVLHEVSEVRDGTRDVIVDWFYGTRP